MGTPIVTRTGETARPISGDQKAVALRAVNRRTRFDALIEWARIFVIAVGLFLVIRAFGVEAFKIPSGSMESTLLVGDFLLVNKFVYGAQLPFTSKHLPGLRRPARGDVVVFQFPHDPTKSFVKRLIGLPADTLLMRDGVLFVNGTEQDESYVRHTDPGLDQGSADFAWQQKALVRQAEASVSSPPTRNNWGPLVVPERSYFVLGDNRDNSSDSRYWGFVPDTLLRGQPLVVYYSYTPDTAASLPWITRIRWTRLGERVH